MCCSCHPDVQEPEFLHPLALAGIELVQPDHEHHGKLEALAAVKRRQLDTWRTGWRATVGLTRRASHPRPLDGCPHRVEAAPGAGQDCDVHGRAPLDDEFGDGTCDMSCLVQSVLEALKSRQRPATPC